MAPFKNPFSTRKAGAPYSGPPNDENAIPASNGTAVVGDNSSKPSLALSIKGSRDEPNEFKMSAVDDSGVYLPPSPTEKKGFWQKSAHSTNSSNHRSMLNEHEPFSISRESFDSYRRSFDISGRSPIQQTDSFTSRSSLDSRAARSIPRTSVNGHTFEKPRPTEEEGFEDVGLNDEPKPKKKGFLSRFGESPADTTSPGAENTAPSHHGFHLPGRKRGQSGKGAELGNIERPGSKGKSEVIIR